MSIIGIGIDAISVERIQSSLNRYGDRFKKRIFTDNERTYCDSRPRPSLHYAARFAAKEAFVKALGTGFRFGIKHSEIEIQHDELGKPELFLYGISQSKAEEMDVRCQYVSLSHTEEIATAIVILEK